MVGACTPQALRPAAGACAAGRCRSNTTLSVRACRHGVHVLCPDWSGMTRKQEVELSQADLSVPIPLALFLDHRRFAHWPR